ncbi:MAG TPA: acyl-CoA desaturase [Actinocatenispora sp.]
MPGPTRGGAIRARSTLTTPWRHPAGAADFTRSYQAITKVVRDTGLLRRARWFYVVLFAGLTLALGGAVAGFLLLRGSWYELLIAAALGVIFTQYAFLAHEAAHRQVFASGPRNDHAARLIGTVLVGISHTWWMTKHTRHHANPNKVGKDPDIAMRTIVFRPETAAGRRGLVGAFTRRQGYLFFPLLLLEGINLHVQAVRLLLARRSPGHWRELALIATHFAVLFGAVFALLPPGMAAAFVGVQLGVFGVYMGSSFAPNHKGMPLVGADENLDFLTKQVRTSRNIRGRVWASALMGGLNYQIEHHLFPNMPRTRLFRTREIVREFCLARGIPYTETGVFASYGAVIRHLNAVGLAARDPFECPLLAARH